MESRRDFLKKALLLSGASMFWAVPESIQKAFAIDPETGSSYLDAEHVVILMQENRSFDHMMGMLQGVRGFHDPRPHLLPNLSPIWLQTNKAEQTYSPFRLNIKGTNATWMGSLPHTRNSQIDARNNGRNDNWLNAKPCSYEGCETMPMTMGHYTREDLPFYYALADAFTICDQHFCASLTATTPNRLYLWSGTLREKQNANSMPSVENGEADYEHQVSWETFPEILEDYGISWKVYQNELSVGTGFTGEEDDWLSNFTDNPLEFFTQYNVRFLTSHQTYLKNRIKEVADEVAKLERNGESDSDANKKKLAKLKNEQKQLQKDTTQWSESNFNQLTQRERNLHNKAFTTNYSDPNYHELELLTYDDGTEERKVHAPKGDVLYQFREDVKNGNLPTVSWLVAANNFSDHPDAPWYGAWYVSEALDILTKNPEVWKKTIFILTYDENDGYFDHVPPFVAPNPEDPTTGKVSEGIDAGVEYVTLEQDKIFRPGESNRSSSIGLGFRVPFIVASPWSRGGCVNSEVFDHTSVLQFLEHFLTHKTGKNVEDPNISTWRRTVCGDLTSIFQPFQNSSSATPGFPSRNDFIEGIYNARFKNPPTDFKPYSDSEIAKIRQNPVGSYLPNQEAGTRRSNPLPYELYADGNVVGDQFKVVLRAGNKVFGKRSSGAPFNAYAYGVENELQARSYAVTSGKSLDDAWALSSFTNGNYHVRVDGPNGFMREFKGNVGDAALEVAFAYEFAKHGQLSGKVEVHLKNHGLTEQKVRVSDISYGASPQEVTIHGGSSKTLILDTTPGYGWYDFLVEIPNYPTFQFRYAGRVETGKWGISDPAMGKIV